jgi:hypothetical protein
MPRIIPSQSFSSDELAQALGEDPKRIRAAIAIMRSGDTSVLADLIAGNLSIEQALKTIEGGAVKAQI